MAAQIEQAMSQIAEAWANVPVPSSSELLLKNAFDEEFLESFFSRRDHSSVKAGELATMSSAFSFFTPVAWHYWIAAFMRCSLESDGNLDVSADRLAHSFMEVGTEASARFRLLTEQQRAAIRSYLECRFHSPSVTEFEVEAFQNWQERVES